MGDLPRCDFGSRTIDTGIRQCLRNKFAVCGKGKAKAWLTAALDNGQGVTHMQAVTGWKIWLIQAISVARIIATLLFVSLLSRSVPVVWLTCLYAFAVLSDAIDGYLARKLQAETFFGKIMDLVADKSLTAVSLLYAAARGIDILPLALVATRDIIMIGMRFSRRRWDSATSHEQTFRWDDGYFALGQHLAIDIFTTGKRRRRDCKDCLLGLRGYICREPRSACVRECETSQDSVKPKSRLMRRFEGESSC